MANKAEIEAFLKREFPQFIQIIESVGDASAILRHRPTDDDLRPGGTISGPTLFALADAALYIAILGEIGIVALAVTTSVTINFLRKPTADRDLIAHCDLIKVGQSLIVGDIRIYSEGHDKPVAQASGTYAIPR